MVAPSTYHAHAARRVDPSKAPARSRSDAELSGAIRRVWDANVQVYRVRKDWRQLRREDLDVVRCTVARLMRMGLKGATRGKAVRTTISDRAAPCPADRVNRQFLTPRPNALWVADFTYVATWQGFVHVAFVIDTVARRIVAALALRARLAGVARRPCRLRARFATLEWVDWFNHRRLLEPIGNIPPAEADARYFAQTDGVAMAA